MGKKKDKKQAKAQRKRAAALAAEMPPNVEDEIEDYAKKTAKYERAASSLAKKAAKFSDNRDEDDHYDFSYTQNREVSWLRFDDRVLDEAFDPSVPLFERLKFCSIFASNLDEWFMIRVGGLSDLATLKHQPVDNKSNETPSEQLDVLFDMLPGLLARQGEAFHGIEASLAAHGLARVTPPCFDEADVEAVTRFYDTSLSPIISPMVVDPRHPFPNLRNGLQYVICSLDGPEEQGVLGMVEVPPSLPRVIPLPSTDETYRYALVEDVIMSRLDGSFGQYRPERSAVVRVTRNADIDPDGEGVEEEEDYRQHMKKVLKRRQRLQPVRLEIEGGLDDELEGFILEELGLTHDRMFRMDMPLDLSYVYGLESRIPAQHKAALVFEPFEPQQSPMVDAAKPVRDQVFDHDVLLFYPYESMRPLLDLLHEASTDDTCISLKITLYRVAKQSRLCESLIAAAENGKDVTVLMELRARFDEENNIEWAERLENAGCTVIYGSEGFKCHSKICQITYHDGGTIRRITCLGTGNFNEKTARLYSDFMLMTAHDGIGEDGNAFFRNLSLGNLSGTYRHLGVAPAGLKPLIMRGLDREIGRARAGQPAMVFMKLNSLTDRDVIDKIAEATQAGVTMVMIIRGICCIRADIPGKTEGLMVHQIVGRLLEHSRVYAFGAESDTVYLSSADMMTRNTERRVEICYPVLDPICREMVIQYMNLQLIDNVKARRLTAGGTWEKIAQVPGAPSVNSQEVLIALAYRRARLAGGDDAPTAEPLDSALESLPDEITSKLLSLTGRGKAEVMPGGKHDDGGTDEVTTAHATSEGLHDEVVTSNAGFVVNDSDEKASDDADEESPLPATHVEAHVIEEKDVSPTTEENPQGTTTLARKAPGRFTTAFALIGLGLKTLFLGRGKNEDGGGRHKADA
ncbi:MAG: polyphosphate kinase 1 [Atopobiaceae bacterium]|jgi:polyphosphate kinase|nr:polyphosphate kinase 1 [Atopobiaceae bacterium]MCI2173113.1 polyphosphate kinase 1 [Atopobiaceae bacterium]MCI2208206.1 polyphosphate kinase 1 [Atopobiaceae bacterium]